MAGCPGEEFFGFTLGVIAGGAGWIALGDGAGDETATVGEAIPHVVGLIVPAVGYDFAEGKAVEVDHLADLGEGADDRGVAGGLLADVGGVVGDGAVEVNVEEAAA